MDNCRPSSAFRFTLVPHPIRWMRITIQEADVTWLRRQGRRLADESGDVPGWVLITLMTAGLVVVIWAVAGPALTQIFESALSRVSGI